MFTGLLKHRASVTHLVKGQSASYREYDTKFGTPEADAWEQWFKDHGFLLAQVPYRGWAARDIRRNTVSALVYDWNLEDSPDGQNTTFYVDKEDDGAISGSRDARYAVCTIQLDHKPLPFPTTDDVEHSS